MSCNDAVVVPSNWAGPKQKAGIIGPDAAYIGHGATWRYERVTTAAPRALPPAATCEGTWFWGGVLFDHFGHFLVESLTRIWAWHHIDEPITGICYLPKRPRRSGDLLGYQRQVLSVLGVDVPAHLVVQPTKFARLIIPGQGFGLGDISSGTPLMRQAMRAHFGANIRADGPDRIYLSRSRLDSAAGAIMGEAILEDHLCAEGYEIFHPQEHDISTQIARYKAARKIIIADGSAGHLYAFVGREHQKVAYLLRRRFWTEGPSNHITSFCGPAPLVLDDFRHEWETVDPTSATRGVAYVQPSMPVLHDRLFRGGFLSNPQPWPEIQDDLTHAYLSQRGILKQFQEVTEKGRQSDSTVP